MAIKAYYDFILVAEDVKKDDKGIIKTFTVRVFDSPVGQGEKKETVTVPEDLSQRVNTLENRTLDQNIDRQIELGEVLAGLLLPSYARDLFRRSLLKLGDDEGIRIRLRLADELADFPWEYLYIQDTRGERTASSFLALDPRISIVRHEALAVPGDWFEAPDKRRIVVAMATPQPHTQYPELTNLLTEQRLLKETFSEIDGIEIDYLPEYSSDSDDQIQSCTLKDLMSGLIKRTDIFHFSGHGEFSKGMGPTVGSIIGEGGIILANEKNQAISIPADRLSEVLRSKGVRLVVLGACQTGRRDGHNVWGSVAASLIKAGIPAVIAMQFTIKDTLAAVFSAALYRALVAGLTIDEAVAMGRAAIRIETLNGQRDIRDWGVPVLYLRSQGGRIFNPISHEQSRQKAEQELEHLIQQHVCEVSGTGRMIGAVIDSMKTKEPVTIKQKVDEDISGFVLGAHIFSLQSGQLSVKQEAGVVHGTMVGTRISNLGGRAPKVLEEKDVLAKLEELLGAKEIISTPMCPNCQTPVEANWNFCPKCKASLSSGL